MAVTSDIIAQGNLTSTSSVIRTGGGTENHVVTFRNKTGGEVTLTIYLNGNTDAKEQVALQFADAETVVFRCVLGNGDTIEAKISSGTTVYWTDEMDALS